eukprot:5437239-Amphidinium_carterae.4
MDRIWHSWEPSGAAPGMPQHSASGFCWLHQSHLLVSPKSCPPARHQRHRRVLFLLVLMVVLASHDEAGEVDPEAIGRRYEAEGSPYQSTTAGLYSIVSPEAHAHDRKFALAWLYSKPLAAGIFLRLRCCIIQTSCRAWLIALPVSKESWLRQSCRAFLCAHLWICYKGYKHLRLIGQPVSLLLRRNMQVPELRRGLHVKSAHIDAMQFPYASAEHVAQTM